MVAPAWQSRMGEACGVVESDGAPIGLVPPPSSRRYFTGRRGDAGCPVCARRARSRGYGLAATSCHCLTATWVVLMVGEPSRPAL
ncbi:hypothetical protein [Sorangium cellulosum]|uniref:hypothetical protein n=1 Tax=Sorangium cellulosum TaxID=56 RepID=UPI00133199A2|nr:hypothetical protein [Sorangium cellulosum]